MSSSFDCVSLLYQIPHQIATKTLFYFDHQSFFVIMNALQSIHSRINEVLYGKNRNNNM